jgi:hypothetical protein
VNAALHSDYRRKGLLWYSTYQVHFGGVYEFVNPDDRPRDVTFTLHLPAEQAIYDDMVFAVNGTPVVLENQKTETYGRATVPPHSTAVLNVGYRSQGLDTWHYNFGDQVSQLRDFELRLTTDFQRVRFSQEYAIADARNPKRSRLGTGLELQESCVRIQNRTRASAKTAARSTRRTNQCLRSRIAAVFLLCAVRPDYDSRHQSAPP